MESSLCVDKHTPYGADKGRFLDRGKKLPILAGDGTYTPQKAADLAYGYASISYPEQLQSDYALRGYLEGMGINPDA